MRKLIALTLLLVGMAFAQSPTKVVNGSGTEVVFAAAGKPFNSTLIAVDTVSPTVVTATTTKVQLIHCTNPTAGAITVSISDGNAVAYFTTVSVAANSVMVVHYGPIGLTYTNGLTVQGGGAGLKCQVEGVQ